jgi:aspartate/methionine/tyrosine aminotransferase
MNPLLDRLGGYPLAAFQDLKHELAADGRPLHDFSIGDPVEPTPAFIRQALVDGLDPVSASTPPRRACARCASPSPGGSPGASA